MAIHVHAACLSDWQNYLDPDPTYKDAYDLPLLRVTFDWHHNDLRTIDYMNECCIEQPGAE
jgi:gluconate 2-dehydrogenase alpha chain